MGTSLRSGDRRLVFIVQGSELSNYLDILSVRVQILSTRSKILSVRNEILSVNFFRVKKYSDELINFQLIGYTIRVFKILSGLTEILSGYEKYYPG